jgi:hypothetical protein
MSKNSISGIAKEETERCRGRGNQTARYWKERTGDRQRRTKKDWKKRLKGRGWRMQRRVDEKNA